MAENDDDTKAEVTMAKIIEEIKQDLDDDIGAEISDNQIAQVAISAIEWAEAHPEESGVATLYEHSTRKSGDPVEYEHGTRD
ncbi:hypothetical protein NDI54_17390 [Haloarcula sp. S1AR25-5A]|uniref:Uncharacterized protein n=1 Tax=Haloarcula terrestris TaxID=2950533 RepID=A0AAE4EZQ2_9EURY|nr:hypothetical protein [Haloarcula terrestris]MDS0223121.1 hypothetical protein [Haloarcula terrestris]